MNRNMSGEWRNHQECQTCFLGLKSSKILLSLSLLSLSLLSLLSLTQCVVLFSGSFAESLFGFHNLLRSQNLAPDVNRSVVKNWDIDKLEAATLLPSDSLAWQTRVLWHDGTQNMAATPARLAERLMLFVPVMPTGDGGPLLVQILRLPRRTASLPLTCYFPLHSGR